MSCVFARLRSGTDGDNGVTKHHHDFYDERIEFFHEHAYVVTLF